MSDWESKGQTIRPGAGDADANAIAAQQAVAQARAEAAQYLQAAQMRLDQMSESARAEVAAAERAFQAWAAGEEARLRDLSTAAQSARNGYTGGMAQASSRLGGR